MANRSLGISDTLHRYLVEAALREPPLLRELREETSRLSASNMQIAPEQGQFMALLAELVGARRAIEIGTFTGYSALCVARALPADGRLIACDISEEYTAVARRYWERAGIAGKIDLRIAPAIETLDRLLADGQSGSFDFGFIDADKQNYDAYYERTLALLRPGGLLAVDNVLWDGQVADLTDTTPETTAIRALNTRIREDERVSMSLVPVGDGLLLARKRP
ncbi:MAG: O-methyltransferase [Alphaproteobacteria bacterium]|nr:MAG: O-methyltransferase [Alphaproteobacteria bacterium]